MEGKAWRFPASNFGRRQGLVNSGIEFFKKSPYTSFAREIMQNSIDARASDEEPTIVEFNEFEIETNKIPGHEELKKAADRCLKLNKSNQDCVDEYKKIIEILNAKKIKCLRVSDYNTTGLVGVNSTALDKNKFMALVKSEGVSEKSTTMAAGSKGTGKNAPFALSSINTIFYSTYCEFDLNEVKGEYLGYIGKACFVSGYINDNNEDPNQDFTQGTGYYSANMYNHAIAEKFKLDPSVKDRTKPGTDIYILGFIYEENWKKDVINSVLDSFMAAIFYGDLEIVFGDFIINKDTLESIVYNDEFIDKEKKANIVSQLRLLKGDNVSPYDIETDYGSCDLYVLPYNHEEEHFATHKCVMIRYPYMKIKNLDLGAAYRCSAMCIIKDNKLGRLLRKIENTEHNDWQTKRIENKNQRKEMDVVLRSIKQQIFDNIMDCLKLNNDDPIDPSGAGDFLPDIDEGTFETKQSKILSHDVSVSVSKIRENKTIDKNPVRETDSYSSLEPDFGSTDDSIDGDIMHPINQNDFFGGESHPGPVESGKKSGDSVVYQRSKLSGVIYRPIATDPKRGKIRISFIAPDTFENCYLNIKKLGDSNEAMDIKILNLECNGAKIHSKDLNEFGPFSIELNKKIILDVDTDQIGLLGCEVKVICK